MRYFVTSDIHGYYDVLKDSLEEAGYQEDNKSHHLIIVGDMFDRGNQSLEVYQYLKRLSDSNKATIIVGNHDYFLVELIEGNLKRVKFNVEKNGFAETIKSFLGTHDFKEELINEYVEEFRVSYPNLKDWILDLPLYLELDNYIFVHGGIDGKAKNWRNSSRRDFTWNKQSTLPIVKDKTIVAGHQRIPTIYNKCEDYDKLFRENKSAFNILREEGVIYIDRFVEISKELNILVLDI